MLTGKNDCHGNMPLLLYQVITPLAGKNISMVFQKRSTRTRLSTESGEQLCEGLRFHHCGAESTGIKLKLCDWISSLVSSVDCGSCKDTRLFNRQ